MNNDVTGKDMNPEEKDDKLETLLIFETEKEDEVRLRDDLVMPTANTDYGICLECGDQIPKSLLDDHPDSKFCPECRDKMGNHTD